MFQERSAGLVIFRMIDKEPNYLLLQYGWNYWGFSKGNIEPGEAEKEAAIREAYEETGLRDFQFVDTFEERIEYYYKRAGQTIHKEVVYFLAETNEHDITLSYEHTSFKWLKFKEALNRLKFTNIKRILQSAKNTIKNIAPFTSKQK
jgi:8-oxo-dGTP pyrophosphatase MutT (NUDIX family)